jgi:flagellar hook assembly protein FlgD
VVRTLVDQDAAAGTFRATWDGLDDSGQGLARGMFFARLATGGKTVETRKLVLE